MTANSQPHHVTGYIELSYLSRVFDVYPATIRRRLRAKGLQLYAHPGDRRFRLVAEEDVRAIFKIIPAPERPSHGEAAKTLPPKEGHTRA